MTVVVSDTGDIGAIQKIQTQGFDDESIPHHGGGPDEGICAAARRGSRVGAARKLHGEDTTAVVRLAIDRLSVEFGLRILKIIEGRVSTEVDARLSYDTAKSIEKARTLIKQYEAAESVAGARAHQGRVHVGRDPRRAAGPREGGHPLQHADAALRNPSGRGMHAEAGVTLISPFVGRILSWDK